MISDTCITHPFVTVFGLMPEVSVLSSGPFFVKCNA